MINGTYLTTEDLYLDTVSAKGIIKKVYAQIAALNKADQLSCNPIILPKPKYKYIFLFISYICIDIYKNISIDPFMSDFIYIRRIAPVNYSFMKLLKKIKQHNKNCRILYEIPTYPYDLEHKNLRQKMNLFIDKAFRISLKKYIDKIITLSNDKEIFGIPTIKIINGIDCDSVSVHTITEKKKNIHLIVLAQFAWWHGYDRLIEGLNNYYKGDIIQDVYIHFVGDGTELEKYKNMVQQYKLSQYITFHGLLSGEKLSNIFNMSNIAVCSLGGHRKGIFLSSELKSREYLARGIPIISSTKIDILPAEFKYCMYVPEDESPVNIHHVINFYDGLLQDRDLKGITWDIRNFAKENCHISHTMKPVIDYLENQFIHPIS